MTWTQMLESAARNQGSNCIFYLDADALPQLWEQNHHTPKSSGRNTSIMSKPHCGEHSYWRNTIGYDMKQGANCLRRWGTKYGVIWTQAAGGWGGKKPWMNERMDKRCLWIKGYSHPWDVDHAGKGIGLHGRQSRLKKPPGKWKQTYIFCPRGHY